MNAELPNKRRPPLSSAGCIVVVDDDDSRSHKMLDMLRARGFQAISTPASRFSNLKWETESPHLLIVSESAYRSGIADAETLAQARSLGVPVIAVLEDETDPLSLTSPFEDFDDWVSVRNLESEFVARVGRVMNRRDQNKPRPSTQDSRMKVDGSFLALVVHDIRNPLNVIKLTLRLLSQSVPKGNTDLAEDLRIIDENSREIERMLINVVDYMKLFEAESIFPAFDFSPSRLVDELLEERAERLGPNGVKVVIDHDPSTPGEVSLEQGLARLAIQYVLENASAASGTLPIRLRTQGGPDRWQTLVTVDLAPACSVKSVELSTRSFERLNGIERERRGLDLAIAARVSEIFGGAARLEVVNGEQSTIVLDWPARHTNSR